MLRIALTLTALVAVAAAAASAQDEPRPTFVKDRRGDAARGPLDVVRAAIGRASDGTLRGEVTMAAGWDAGDLRPGGSVCLRIYVRRAPDAQVPEHLVCASARREGDRLVGRVLRDRANGLPVPVGSARVSRPTGRTVFLRFSQTAIGKPSRIEVSAEAVSRGRGCPAPLGCRDLAPEAPGAMELRLRSAADQR